MPRWALYSGFAYGSVEAPVEEEEPAQVPLRVTAIGGDAGWGSTETVLAQLPARPGFAVIALAAADDVAPAIARLAERARLPVVAASDGATIDSDHAYVVPQSVDAVVEHGRLRLVPPAD